MISFRPWQQTCWQQLIANRLNIVVGCRGAGKDWLLALFCVLHAATGQEFVVLNKDERQNKKFIRECKKVIKDLEKNGFSFPTIQDNVLEISHTSGGRIEALASRPDNLQGYHCHVIINELGANLNDGQEIITQALAVVGTQHRMVIASNADGSGSWLEKVLNSEEPLYQTYREMFQPQIVTAYDAFPDDECERIKNTLPRRDWDKWYLCKFTGNSERLIDIEERAAMLPLPSRFDVMVAAYDVGTSKDPSALVVLGKSMDEWHLVHCERFWDVPLEQQAKNLLMAKKRWGFAKCGIDKGVNGTYLVQALSRDKTFIPLHFGSSFVMSQLNQIKQMVVTGKFHVDEKFKLFWEENEEFRCGTDSYTKTHAVASDKAGRKHHCDIIDATVGAISFTGLYGHRSASGTTFSGRLSNNIPTFTGSTNSTLAF
jgi:hypothetical protein